jgi:signal transduction histidine kinase
LVPSLIVDLLLGLAACAVLVAGAVHALRRRHRRDVRAAVLDERRRIARELHDGVAQDLAFIAARARHMVHRGTDRAGLEDIGDAAARALDESRRAIAALRRADEVPFRERFDAAAVELEHREGARLRYRIPADFDPPSASGDALLGIVREAVTNAARHARASEVEIELSRNGDLHMRIRDNGDGFEPDDPRGGFGLAGMRERARALGGDLRLSSQPGAGTEIEVVLP